ncbi:MAG: DUF4278 domain-containing protein [Cyanobacteria bacterium J06597_16]
MKLTYHGATYTYTNRSIETVETDIKCSFLGKTTKLRVPKFVPTQQVLRNFTYRGSHYQA